MRLGLVIALCAAAGRAQDERTGIFSAARRQLAVTRSETYPNSGKQITEITNGLRNNRYYDKNSCPEGHTIWVPESWAEANWARNEFGTTYTNVVGVFKTTPDCQDCKENMEMNSGWSDPLVNPSNHGRYWKSVSRTPDENEGNCGSCSTRRDWFMRATPFKEPNGNHQCINQIVAARPHPRHRLIAHRY